MSTNRSIQITDQHGVVLTVMRDEFGTIEASIAPEGSTVELDETDRRDLSDWMGAR